MAVSQKNTVAFFRIFLMGILLMLPGLSMICQVNPEVDLLENRVLAPFPEFSWGEKKFEGFTSTIDRYLEDHFGFRKVLTLIELKWKTRVARKPLVQSVLFGRNGWLFYADEDAMTNYRGLISFTDDQIGRLVKIVEAQHTFCKKRGIRYVLLIAPDKKSIYSEHMPSWLMVQKTNSLTDQMVASLSNKTEVCVVDIRNEMSEFKRESIYRYRYPLYWKTDTHWTRMGAFVSYKATIDTLRRWFPNIPGTKLSDFKLKNGFRKGGDLAKMVGMEQNVLEVGPALKYVRRRNAKRMAVSTSYKSSYDLQEYPDDRLLIMETGFQELPKAVMFRDSFGDELVPLLSEHFSRIVYRWHYLKSFHFDVELINKESPDVVIYQIIERSIVNNFIFANAPSLLAEARGNAEISTNFNVIRH